MTYQLQSLLIFYDLYRLFRAMPYLQRFIFQKFWLIWRWMQLGFCFGTAQCLLHNVVYKGGICCWDVSVCWPDCKPEGPLFLAEFVCDFVCLSVCLSVCLWQALLAFSVDRFWWNLATRTLLWSSLAATIMVQIGRTGTARRLFEIFKIFAKITEF